VEYTNEFANDIGWVMAGFGGSGAWYGALPLFPATAASNWHNLRVCSVWQVTHREAERE
jgi:hypothetical protein